MPRTGPETESRAHGPRRQAREAALQVLYAADISGDLNAHAAAEAYDRILDEFSLPVRARERARSIVEGVVSSLKQIDEQIGTASTHWKLHRIATVDRNILRVATWELLFERDTPAEVVIDEAVEIARRFGGESSPRFVNGVLDVVARNIRPR